MTTHTKAEADNGLQARINAELAEAFKDDPAGACRAHAAITAALASQPQPQANMVRYCPGCGSIGDVESTYRNCCPDGSMAYQVPQAFAEQCHGTFKIALSAVYQRQAGAAWASDVKTWQERMTEAGGDIRHGVQECAPHMRAEIADLRAQLKAPVGESIDTQEFRQLANAWSAARNDARGWADPSARWKELIAYIDAQLARLRQGEHETSAEGVCKEADGCPTEMAVLKRFWREHQAQAKATAKSAPAQFAKRYVELSDENHTLKTRLAELEAAAQADEVRDAEDTARLDWLADQFVTVRIPLRYGSKECFMGSPDDDDGESVPWDIRTEIDAAMRTTAADNQKGGAA